MAEIRILVDNNAKTGFERAWGLSIYVKVDEEKFLFDLGPSSGILLRNSRRAGIRLEEANFVALSHPHGDHVGGISAFYSFEKKPDIYLPFEFPSSDVEYLRSLGFKVFKVMRGERRGKVVFEGDLGPKMPEIVAIVEGKAMLTGCSHNGIVNIVKKMRERGHSFEIIIGGLHTFSLSMGRVEEIVEELLELGIKKIAPIHCSGRKILEYLREDHPENLLPIKGGSCVKI